MVQQGVQQAVFGTGFKTWSAPPGKLPVCPPNARNGRAHTLPALNVVQAARAAALEALRQHPDTQLVQSAVAKAPSGELRAAASAAACFGMGVHAS